MRRRSRFLSPLVALAVTVAVLVGSSAAAVGADRPARILVGEPATLDPAAQGDADSAAVTAQLFETLTTFDGNLQLQPALADSWRIADDGTQVVFHVRPDLSFSDGTPLRASDVVRSWLRLIDPAHPSPLASLALVIDGAQAYMTRAVADPASVALHADDASGNVTVGLVRPAADFVDVVSSPSFGIVPSSADRGAAAFRPGNGFVGSGGYTATATSDTGITLTANDHYWAGKPAITTIELVTDIGGRSPVEVFGAGDLDYTPIDGSDASWIGYDETLGPQLREVPQFVVQYYGFDTSRPPFDKAEVRQAVAMAVDWRRISVLGSPTGDDPAPTSMVPPGIPGRSDVDAFPKHDPDAARALLAKAGYPGGAGFPAITMLTGGGSFDEAIVDELHRELGITVTYETMAFSDYYARILADPPAIWSLGWVADYPSRNDFLGVLLGKDSTNDFGKWHDPEFDAAIADAGAATDPAAANAAYDRAEAIVGREVPVFPMAYGTGWALSRDGLLGAGQNGLGNLRMAGLAWAD
jgi:oligopeptide transport system substrate-binding protein